MTHAAKRLLELLDLLREVAELADAAPDQAIGNCARIGVVVRRTLDDLDVRCCVDCGRRYFHNLGTRHYRCANCRWKRHLVAANAASGKSATSGRMDK